MTSFYRNGKKVSSDDFGDIIHF